MFKKSLTIMVMLSLLLVGFTGLSQADAEKIRVAWWSGGEPLELHKRISQNFTEKTGIKVEWQVVTQGYDQKMVTAYAAGDVPDVLLYWNTPKYVESNLVMDISPYIDEENYSFNQTYEIIQEFISYKGKYYGISSELTPRAIYYNKDLFDKYNVSYPEEGWTWDDFYNKVDRLTHGKGKDATYGYVALTGDTYLMQQYIWSNGGDLVSPDGQDAIGYMDSPEVVETVKWYKSIFDISAQTIVTDRTTQNLGETSFLSGNVAMMDNGSWPLLSFKENEDLNFGVVTPPVPEEGMDFHPVIHSSAWGISPKSDHKEAAWKFIKYMATKEAGVLVGQRSIPTNRKAVKALGQDKDEHFQVFIELAEKAQDRPCFMRNSRWFEADTVFKDALDQIMLQDADVEKTLHEAAKRADKILKGEW